MFHSRVVRENIMNEVTSKVFAGCWLSLTVKRSKGGACGSKTCYVNHDYIIYVNQRLNLAPNPVHCKQLYRTGTTSNPSPPFQRLKRRRAFFFFLLEEARFSFKYAARDRMRHQNLWQLVAVPAVSDDGFVAWDRYRNLSPGTLSATYLLKRIAEVLFSIIRDGMLEAWTISPQMPYSHMCGVNFLIRHGCTLTREWRVNSNNCDSPQFTY
jgi:hypothetical protein